MNNCKNTRKQKTKNNESNTGCDAMNVLCGIAKYRRFSAAITRDYQRDSSAASAHHQASLWTSVFTFPAPANLLDLQLLIRLSIRAQ